MKLSLRNIGKIGRASVDIDGITVIAGANNTGKSTVGKALFAVFNSVYDIKEKIAYERMESIEKTIAVLNRKVSHGYFFHKEIERVAKKIVLHADTLAGNDKKIKHEVLDVLFRLHETFDESICEEDVEETVRSIQDILKISDLDIFKVALEKRLNAEFNGQINNIFSDERGEIDIQIKDEMMQVVIDEDSVVDIKNRIDLQTEAVYLDDPLVLDELGKYAIRAKRAIHLNYADHRDYLKDRLVCPEKDTNIIDEIMVKNKLERIYKKISPVCNGKLVRNQSSGFGYQESNGERVLDVGNLSTGLKTFAILKTLLMNGTIEYHGVVILDEPEIHLHPEWQLLFAELIVMLHKEFDMHVLLNTHSPYFLRAIQVYAAKYGVADLCRYYLSEEMDAQISITDVTNDIEKIYARLSRSLQDLEDERWESNETI